MYNNRYAPFAVGLSIQA